MSTNDYLESLNYDQLVYAKKKAQRLIDAKQAEKKVLLWQVTNGFAVYETFWDHQYVEAAKCLLDKAKEFAQKGRHERLDLNNIMVFESEAIEYMEG